MCRRDNLLIIQKRAESIRSVAAFFCLKSQISYTRYGRLGRAASRWPYSLLDGIVTPVRSATIIVTSNGGRFKTYKREIVMKASTHVLKHSHTSHTRVKNRPIKSHINVIEHTPIYDLKAFEKRQKQRKLNQLVKTTLSHCFVFVTFTLAFSLLFIGE